jgi:hypothetical protein
MLFCDLDIVYEERRGVEGRINLYHLKEFTQKNHIIYSLQSLSCDRPRNTGL